MRTTHDLMIPHDGIEFRCRLDGSEGAPWLVFSNSLLTDLTLWDAQVDTFGQWFRILRYDQRGHGGSGLGNGPITLGRLIADANALCEVVGVREAVFVGASLGAATALGLAASVPELISQVVASDGQARTAPGGRETWQERIDAARARGMEAVVEATLSRWFGQAFRDPGHPDLPRALRMMRGTTLEGYAACAGALRDYDVSTGLATLRQPTLLIAGANDGAMPATMRSMQAAIPDARFVEIPEAGHLPNLERPAAFNAALREFLDAR